MVIYDRKKHNNEYYWDLERHFKKIRCVEIDPDEELLDEEIPIRILKKYSSFFKNNNMFYLMNETNIYIADKLYFDKHYESSLSWYMKVLNEVKVLPFYNKTPHIYRRMGLCEFKKSSYKESLTYYMKGKVEGSRQNDKTNYSECVHNIALTYLYLDDYRNANLYIEELLTLYCEDKNNIFYASALILKAQLYFSTKFIQKSITVCDVMIQNINNYDNNTQEKVYIFVAYLYWSIRNKNAIYYAEVALRYCMESKNYDMILILSNTLDKIYKYYHHYTRCHENLKKLIDFLTADKLHRKYCNLYLFDMLIMKIRLMHYKCLSLSK